MDEANALVPHDQQLLLQHQQHIFWPQPQQPQQYHRLPQYEQPQQQYHCPPQPQQQQLLPQQHAMSIFPSDIYGYLDLPGFERQEQNPNPNLQQQPQPYQHHHQQLMANQAVAAMLPPESTLSSLEHPHQRGESETPREVGYVEAHYSLLNQVRKWKQQEQHQQQQQQQYQQPLQQQQQYQQPQQQQQQQHGISSFPSNSSGHLHLPGLQQNEPNLNLQHHHQQQMVNPVGPEMAFLASHLSSLGHAYERWRKQNELFCLFLDKELKY